MFYKYISCLNTSYCPSYKLEVYWFIYIKFAVELHNKFTLLHVYHFVFSFLEILGMIVSVAGLVCSLTGNKLLGFFVFLVDAAIMYADTGNFILMTHLFAYCQRYGK